MSHRVSGTPRHATARIGPNALLQLVLAVRAGEGETAARRILHRARLESRLAGPLEGLVPVTEVVALHAALLDTLDRGRARALVADAGRRTAGYLLAHRIPAPFQRLLALCPRPLARRLLLAAIGRHAWTFTGGGRFSARPGPPLQLRIEPCPLCPGEGREGLGCVYYAATFETLLQRLVDPSTRIEPAACGAAGSRCCLLLAAPTASGRPS